MPAEMEKYFAAKLQGADKWKDIEDTVDHRETIKQWKDFEKK